MVTVLKYDTVAKKNSSFRKQASESGHIDFEEYYIVNINEVISQHG